MISVKFYKIYKVIQLIYIVFDGHLPNYNGSGEYKNVEILNK